MRLNMRLLAALLGASLSLADSVAAEVINKIVATVDGQPITQREVERLRAGTVAPGRPELDYATALDAVLTEKLVEREAAQKGISISDEDVSRYVDSIKERNQIDDDKLAAALTAQGLSIAAYREQVRREIQRQQLISREIRGKVNVSPEEVERYYRAHIGEYGTPAGYRVAHIVIALAGNASNADVVAARAKADGIYDKLVDGADFATMAKEYSDDKGSARDGGVLGWFKQGELVESLEKEALQLDVDEISEPVRGPQGFHILKLLETRSEGGELAPEQAEQIKEKLYGEALETRFTEWLKTDLRQRHHVEILP